MTEFDVTVRCPDCGAQFAVPRIRRGNREPCPVCGGAVLVPGGEAYDEDLAGPSVPPGIEPGILTPEPDDEPPAAPPRAVRATGRCLVCTMEEAKVNPVTAGAVIAEFTGQTHLDACRQINEGLGVLAEALAPAVAGQLAARLSGLGIAAFAMDEGSVLGCQEMGFVCLYDVRDDGLCLQTDTQGTMQLVPWQAVLGGFCHRDYVASGGPTDLERHDTFGYRGARYTTYHAKPRPEPREPECTLVVSDRPGTGRTIRFGEHKVRYAYLGDRREPGGLKKFELAISDILRHCPHAYFPPSTWCVATGQSHKIALMMETDDYPAYLRWLLCRIAHERRQRGG